MKITLSHGSGGKATSELIDKIFAKHFSNPVLNLMEDSAVVDGNKKIAITTDSFVVTPLFFKGGDIGRLAVCGTVNDLLMRGAKAKYITSAFIIEEGADTDTLEKIVCSMAKTADEAGVIVVAGDTKVAGKGQVDGVFITTTGMGEIQEGVETSGFMAKPGDAVLAPADGVISKIAANEEIGTYLCVTLGDEYQAIIGNMDNVSVAEGDYVLKGTVLGGLAEPTKYYVTEGPNLYFELQKNGEPVDPLDYLE